MVKGIDAIQDKLEKLKEFQQNAPKYAIDAVMEEKAIVLDMNFEEQLYLEGVNRNNVPIMDYQPYSPATEFIKQQKRQPYDRVTLRDGGDFHSDGDIERIDDVTAEIISIDQKSEWLQDKYGKEILGLKPDNMTELKENYVKPYLHKKLEEI